MIDTKFIRKELSNLPTAWIVMLETDPENMLDVSISTIKMLTSKSYVGVVLSVSRPYSNLVNVYKRNKINIEKIFFIDCVTENPDKLQKKVDNVTYLEYPYLTNISIALNSAINKIKGNKFVYIDSITTLLIHNPTKTLVQFIHSVVTGLRIKGTNCLLISLKGKIHEEVRAEIAQLCDKVIKI